MLACMSELGFLSNPAESKHEQLSSQITEYDVHVCVCVCVVCVKSLWSKYVHINNRQVLTVSKCAVRLGTLSSHYNYFVE